MEGRGFCLFTQQRFQYADSTASGGGQKDFGKPQISSVKIAGYRAPGFEQKRPEYKPKRLPPDQPVQWKRNWSSPKGYISESGASEETPYVE
jgi:hypothetical protein